MKTASFTLRGDVRQSARWKQASEAEGYASVGQWAAFALDAFLESRVRAGRPFRLAWHRRRFSVRLGDGEVVPVSGHASPPFASFAGTEDGPANYCGRHRHVLVLLETGEIVAVLKSFAQVKALAAELAPALIRRELPEPSGIIERHRREST